MPGRRVDDFDDDDYFPGEPLKAPSRGFPQAVFWGVVLGVVVLVGLSLFFLRSSRQAAAERNMVELARAEAAMREPPIPPLARDINWNRAIGTWRREPAGLGDTTYPVSFIFRQNRTVSTTRRLPEGGVKLETYQVEITNDDEEELTVVLRVPMEVLSYQFRLDPNGTLVLKVGNVSLIYVRDD